MITDWEQIYLSDLEITKRELIKHVTGRDLSKYGQYGCKKLNKRNKKTAELGVVPNSNI